MVIEDEVEGAEPLIDVENCLLVKVYLTVERDENLPYEVLIGKVVELHVVEKEFQLVVVVLQDAED